MTMAKEPKLVYRFQIALLGIDPAVWRRIEVPASYSFWDLHVAIQDAMGWLDYHLHVFNLYPKHKRKPVQIGIPDDDFMAHIEAGWDTLLSTYFTEPGQTAEYEYDFGDGWLHRILFEGILLPEEGATYPRCLAGEQACPPEDCGGVGGYLHLLDTLSDPKSEEHDDMVAWLKGHQTNDHPFDPNEFKRETVVFSDPKKRFKRAFGH